MTETSICCGFEGAASREHLWSEVQERIQCEHCGYWVPRSHFSLVEEVVQSGPDPGSPGYRYQTLVQKTPGDLAREIEERDRTDHEHQVEQELAKMRAQRPSS